MAIEIYHIPPGNRDFRESLLKRLINEVKGPDYSGIYHLAPTSHISNAWKRAFHKAAGKCYIPPQAMTLRQLSKRLCTTYAGRPVISRALIPVIISGLEGSSPGHSNIVADMISELKQHYPNEPPDSIRKTLDEVLAELDIPEEVRNRTMNSMDMFLRYDNALKLKGFMDEDDTLPLAAELAREKRLKPDILLLDGFYEITPAEELLIRNLISVSGKTIATIPIDINDDLTYCYSNNLKNHFNIDVTSLPASDPMDKLFFRPSPSLEEEINDIARHIKGSFITGRARELDDIYLVFPSQRLYMDMTERIFKRYGIPLNFSTSRPFSRSRPYIDLLSLLEAVSEDYPRLKFSRFLSSSFFYKIPAILKKSVPAVALNAGIVKGRDSWIGAFRKFGAHEELLSVFKILKPLDNIKYIALFGDFVKVILNILRTLRFMPFAEPDGGLSELEAVLYKFSVLDEILGKKVDLAFFADTLRRILDEPPRHSDEPGVRAAGLFEVRGLEPESLYMAGLKDGDLPSRPDIDFMLPDSVRRHLGLVDMKRHLRLQEHIFRRLVQASKRNYLSYPTMEGEKFFLPSVFLSDAEEKIEKISGVFSKEEALLSRGRKKLEAHFGEIQGIKQALKTINVTDIDGYRSCPRRFYIEKVLRLEPPEILEFEMDALTLGTLAHEVMERLITIPFENIEEFTRNASEALDKTLSGKPLDEYLKSLFRETFMEIIPEIYKLEESINADGFSFHKAEYKLEGEPFKGIRLRGKVDRIDLTPGGAAEVIDYKTGSPQFSSSRVLKKGALLQLFLYAALLKKTGMRPERVGIYSLKDMKIKWIPGKKDIDKGNTLDLFIDAALGFLKDTVTGMRSGDFRARPLEEQSCRTCPEGPYCPYIQGDPRTKVSKVQGP
jgi:ATP-dependent helicase/DNAse subunit B